MFHVKRDGLIYEVKKPSVLDIKDMSLIYNLELVCGIDYVNPDYSDIQGWVDSSRFTDSVKDEDILVLSDESLIGRLDEEGFVKIDKLPKIHVVKTDE